MEHLGILCLVLLSTALAGHFSRRIGMPAVIGQLLVGIILGPAVLGWVVENDFVHTFFRDRRYLVDVYGRARK